MLSYGSLYPCLRQMQHDGLLTEDTTVPDPAAALTSRRGKIVYKLTAEGKERFADARVSRPARAPGTTRTSASTSRSSARRDTETRLRILEGRRSRLEERLEGVRTSLARSRERLDTYTLELQRHGLESVEREVRWLTELIDSERVGAARPRSSAAAPYPHHQTKQQRRGKSAHGAANRE